MDRLEKQNQELLEALQSLPVPQPSQQAPKPKKEPRPALPQDLPTLPLALTRGVFAPQAVSNKVTTMEKGLLEILQ